MTRARQSDSVLAMPNETLLERATRRYHGLDPYRVTPDAQGHRLRGSDASTFDVLCITCGATDRAGTVDLQWPCPEQLPPRKNFAWIPYSGEGETSHDQSSELVAIHGDPV